MRKRLLAQRFVCVRRVPSRLSSQRAMLFTVLLGLAAAVDMHQKVTPVQKVPATEHGLISFDRTEEEEFQNLESLRLWLMSEGVR